MRLPGFCNGSYPAFSANIDAERTVNLYPEIQESPSAKAQASLCPTPGFKTFCTLTQPSVRTLYALPVDNRVFAVGGTVVYEVFSDGTFIPRDSIVGDVLPATCHYNGVGPNQCFITSGGHGYIYDVTTNVLTLDVVTNVSRGDVLDTFFLALDSITHELRISESNDGINWDPTQVASRSTASDPWITFVVASKKIILIGSETGEIWYNRGLTPYPFDPVPDAFFPIGITATRTLQDVQGVALWLARNKQGQAVVAMLSGYTPQIVSSVAVARSLQRYSRVDDAVSWTYQCDQHTFYVLSFLTAGATWVLDLTTMLWHERPFWNPNTASEEACRAQCSCFAFGKHLVGDRASGQILEMSSNQHVDVDGAKIRRKRRTPIVADENVGIEHKRFELDLEVGLVSIATSWEAWLLEDGSDWTMEEAGAGSWLVEEDPIGFGVDSGPTIILRWSDDQGKTWEGELEMDAGPIGAYRQRARVDRLGMSPMRIYEVDMTDAAPWRIADAYLELARTAF